MASPVTAVTHLAALLLTLTACSNASPRAAEASVPLAPGRYAADLTFDAAAAPVAMMFEVGEDGTIRVLDAGYFRFGANAAPVDATGGALRFILPTDSTGRVCVLLPAGRDGWHEGRCTRSGQDEPWILRLQRLDTADGALGVSAWALERSGASWATSRGRHVRVHVPLAHAAALDTADLRAFADSAAEANLAWLGEAAYPRRLDLFLLRDREEMTANVGRGSGGHADAYGTAALVTNYGAGRTVVQHELMHVMSHNLWGPPWQGENWLREGVGTAAPGRCAAWDLQTVAARLHLDGRLLPLEALMQRFNQHDDVVTYLQAGALIQHLREAYGVPAVKALWQGGGAGLQAATGRTLTDVDTTWREQLGRHAAAAAGVDVEGGIRETGKGCR